MIIKKVLKGGTYNGKNYKYVVIPVESNINIGDYVEIKKIK